MAHQGSMCLRTGRQVGKSTVVAFKAAEFAKSHPGTCTLVTAPAIRQSSLLFEKIRGEIEGLVQRGDVAYAEEPTQTKIVLSNGSKIYALPAGRTGIFVRGFTIDLLIVDEAAYIPEVVWRAVIPMVAVSRKMRGLGWIILLSTPFGKGGFFYEAFHDSDFRPFHVSSEQCPRIPRDFLAKEKRRMSKAEYAQEYLGEFMDEFNQMFPSALIKQCTTFMEWGYDERSSGCTYYLGVDIARYGGDENAFVIAEWSQHDKLRIVKTFTTSRVALTETIGRIVALDERMRFARIFVDDAGVGGGVMDVLLEKLGRRVVGLNNARRSVDHKDTQRSILKEDLYSNALVLMESNRVELVNDLPLVQSLKGVTFEYTSERRISIGGKWTHLAEAYVRALWCVRDRGLRPYIA